MKQHIKITFAALLLISLVSFSSCKKYFDAKNNSTISQASVFESEAYTESAVTGIYAMLIGDNGYGSRIATLYPQTTDEFRTSGSYSPLDRRGISMYGAASTNAELLAPFLQLYRGIERANICIKYIPASSLYNSSDAKASNMRRLYGEALTLRAQFYYELIRNWGDVPFHKVPAADLVDSYLPKTDRDSIYDYLLVDLDSAARIVPWRSGSVGGFRVTQGFVRGLRARIALARGGYSLRRAESQYGQVMARPSDYLKYYQIARDECFEIMLHRGEHTLNPKYEDVFRSLHGARLDNANELMMEVGAFGGNAATDSKLGYYNGLRHNVSSKYGQGGGGMIGIGTYFYEFDSVGDCRRDVTLNCYEIDANSQAILNIEDNMTDGKFRRSWTSITGTAQNNGINWPLMRFADVLLMFAEADNELKGAPSAEAIEAYEEVRKRAFIGFESRMGMTPADKAGFFQALVHERLLEFGGEGIRKYDLIRWNLIDAVFKETRIKLRELSTRTGRYENVPTVIYTKGVNYDPAMYSNAIVNSLDFPNGMKASEVFFTPQTLTSAPTGYTSKAWATGTNELDITGTSAGFATYFTPNHSELYPIHVDVLTTNFRLKQDYGY